VLTLAEATQCPQPPTGAGRSTASSTRLVPGVTRAQPGSMTRPRHLVPVLALVLLPAGPAAAADPPGLDPSAPVPIAPKPTALKPTALKPTALKPTALGAWSPASGRWPLLPVPEVAREFHPPDTPWGAGHRGVDLVGSPGQSVRAALAGRVTFAGLLAGRGVVVVDHGSTRTTYEPVVSTARPGDALAAGDAVGTLSLAGSHCLPRSCVHWGWLRGAEYLDPLTLVTAGPARLLPLAGLPQQRVRAHPPWPRCAGPAWAQARGWACW
jgi:murein DD-endopeptidase MepM/ murein hydrolase activator NlpD